MPMAATIDIITTSTVASIATGLAMSTRIPTMITPNAIGMMVCMSLKEASGNA